MHNGTECVTIHTRHGQFVLRRARLRDAHGQEVHLPCPAVSAPLRERALFWANRLSFGDVARLLEQMAGAAVRSEDRVWRLVQRQAEVIDAAQRQAILASSALLEPE